MAQVTKYVISTKQDEDADAKNTTVEVDFDGFTIEHAKTMFFKSTSPRVAVQSALRRVKGGIPVKWACKALDFATKAGTGERVMTPQEMLEYAKHDVEYMAELKKALGITK